MKIIADSGSTKCTWLLTDGVHGALSERHLAALLHGAPVFDGIWPACLGTLYLVALVTVMVIPLGVASGIFRKRTTSSMNPREIAAR